jgi:hypothetical protein
MNNLGTVEQGAKVWKNVLRQLDKNEKITSLVMKDVDFYNLSKFLRFKNDNRIYLRALSERSIRLVIRNVYPANQTEELREVTVKMKPRSL